MADEVGRGVSGDREQPPADTSRQRSTRARTEQTRRAAIVARNAADFVGDAQARAVRSREDAENARLRMESLRDGVNR